MIDEGALRVALARLQKAVGSGKLKDIHEQYFEGRLSYNYLAEIVSGKRDVNRCRPSVKRLLLNFALRGQSENTANTILHRSIKDNLPNSQPVPQIYLQTYNCYRPSTGDGLIEGVVQLFRNADDADFFRHTSEQSVKNGRIETFEHRGPVFMMSDRLYLLGVGQTTGGGYIRTMILKSNDAPEQDLIAGMVLTETVGHVPIASKTVLRNKEFDDDRRKMLGAVAFGAEVRSALKNESSSKDIVYGWSTTDI